MIEAMIVAFLVFVLIAVLFAIRRITKPQPYEEDEHATMVRPRDKHGRWVREGDGIVTPKGPSASWNRKKQVRK